MTQLDGFAFSEYEKKLRQLNFDSLPGLEAQMKMAPEIRQQEIKKMAQSQEAIKSSVLFLFYPGKDSKTQTVFIQRPDYDGVHGGQISFPGGRFEKEDLNLENTALREAREEVGIEPGKVEIFGQLSDLYIPPSNFLVRPFLGFYPHRPDFAIDPVEVAALLEVDVSAFFHRENKQAMPIVMSNGMEIKTPCFSINSHIIWGATAMIISEFVELYRSMEA